MGMRFRVLVFLGAMGAAWGVRAADAQAPAPPTASPSAPFVTPQQDVDILYAVPMPDGTNGGQRMRWSRAGLVQRVDLDGSATYMVTDYRARVLHVLDTRNHTQAQMAAPGGALTLPGEHPAGVFGSETDDTVAGEPCHWWRTADSDGQQARFCYAADGVLLAAQRGGVTIVRAVRVTRAPQDAGIFAMPEGYRRISAPSAAP